MDQVVNALESTSVNRLVWAVAILLICLLLMKYLMKLLDRVLARLPNLNGSVRHAIRWIVEGILIFLTASTIANVLGISTTSFVAIFSVMGVALSLAAQGVLTNFLGGVIVLVSHPFVHGDYVAIDTTEGTVDEISFLYTKLVTLEGKTVYIPNNLVQSSRLTNFNSRGTRRVEIAISASYDNTPQEVRTAALDAISTFGDLILKDPAPEVCLNDYGDNNIDYLVRVWVRSADFGKIRFGLNEELFNAFARNGVQMSYPHVNVHTPKQ